jgi:CHAD domain-containing protein
MALKAVEKSVLMSALKAQGRKAGDYSSKLTLQLEPNLPAHQAVKKIYKQLLQTIKLNEQGTIAAIDSEFLHDFRVAVRRTRTGLSLLKAALPPEITDCYSSYFSWLSQITSVTRDLNVYLLNFADYQACLPESMRGDIEPLRELLQHEQTAAQKELVLQLRSKQYLTPLINWEQYLKLSVEQTLSPEITKLSIKQLADLKIWKIYQRVIKHGFAITEHSPAVALHDLRKTCKKLRYLIEFFHSLYPAVEIKAAIKALKELQELLGDFQDCTVQEQALTQFSAKMRQSGCSEQTFSATTELVQVLDAKRRKARADFSGCFSVFASSENGVIFKSLFVNKA